MHSKKWKGKGWSRHCGLLGEFARDPISPRTSFLLSIVHGFRSTLLSLLGFVIHLSPTPTHTQHPHHQHYKQCHLLLPHFELQNIINNFIFIGNLPKGESEAWSMKIYIRESFKVGKLNRERFFRETKNSNVDGMRNRSPVLLPRNWRPSLYRWNSFRG